MCNNICIYIVYMYDIYIYISNFEELQPSLVFQYFQDREHKVIYSNASTFVFVKL